MYILLLTNDVNDKSALKRLVLAKLAKVRFEPDRLALERSNLLKFALVKSQFSHFLVFMRVFKSFSS